MFPRDTLTHRTTSSSSSKEEDNASKPEGEESTAASHGGRWPVSAHSGSLVASRDGNTAECGPYDVICGRHPEAAHNIGNRRFRVTVDMAIDQFKSGNDPGKRSHVIKRVIELVHSTGGRFIHRVGDAWEELDSKETYQKVGYALRERAVALADHTKPSASRTKTKPADNQAAQTKKPSPGYKLDEAEVRMDRSADHVQTPQSSALESKLQQAAMPVSSSKEQSDEFSVEEDVDPIQWPPSDNFDL